MTSSPKDRETLESRLSQIERLLSTDPALADKQAGEIVAQVPGHSMALLFQGIARRLRGDPESAIRILAPLCRGWPEAPLPHLQLGLALRETSQNEPAVQSMRRAVALKPDFCDAWMALADLLTATGEAAAADAAFASYIRCCGSDPDMAAAAAALHENRPADAEPILRSRLQRQPMDVAAMCLLADIVARNGQLNDAEMLLSRCLALSPSYRAARQNYALVLMWQNRPAEALSECNRLLAAVPGDPGLLNVKANVLRRLGEYKECIGIYEAVLDRDPGQPKVWTSLGHTLRTQGRTQEGIGAFRKALALAPHFGEAYWSLANIKPSPMSDSDIAAMQRQLDQPDLALEDRIHFNFAIGKALEDRGEYAESFRRYADGNRLFHQAVQYDPAEMTDLVHRCRALFSRAFFAARAGSGTSAADPIFIVGLPRAGSTLVEQILSSHSAVEGTAELPDIPALVKSLDGRSPGLRDGKYPEVLAGLEPDRIRKLGATYLEQTRPWRKRGTPFFIDKMPNNFAHAGFIHLILPNARTIDVRRHPMACGFSLFKLLFGHGQHFAYSLEDIGRYYRDYVELMSHCDSVLPGHVLRVLYENLVRDTETEVRRMLEYCGLPFEPGCLRFHETIRPVSTPSAEQVRSPIYRESLDHWRHYEQWLGPLRAGLDGLDRAYPDPAPVAGDRNDLAVDSAPRSR